MTALVVDRDMIADFIDALFRYADEGTYVQLRAFVDSSNGGTWGNCPAVKMNGVGPSELIDTAAHYAQRCANAAEPVVFCPPIVTLKNAITAAEKDVANGIALSVECDQAPSKACALLEFLLGPATIVVKSGGEWTCPVTGVVEAKLHLHWRLQEPTRAHDRPSTAEGSPPPRRAARRRGRQRGPAGAPAALARVLAPQAHAPAGPRSST